MYGERDPILSIWHDKTNKIEFDQISLFLKDEIKVIP